jgi:hypothetical protein
MQYETISLVFLDQDGILSLLGYTHTGSLKCISAPGKGAEFMIKIPLLLEAKT